MHMPVRVPCLALCACSSVLAPATACSVCVCVLRTQAAMKADDSIVCCARHVDSVLCQGGTIDSMRSATCAAAARAASQGQEAGNSSAGNGGLADGLQSGLSPAGSGGASTVAPAAAGGVGAEDVHTVRRVALLTNDYNMSIKVGTRVALRAYFCARTFICTRAHV